MSSGGASWVTEGKCQEGEGEKLVQQVIFREKLGAGVAGGFYFRSLVLLRDVYITVSHFVNIAW